MTYEWFEDWEATASRGVAFYIAAAVVVRRVVYGIRWAVEGWVLDRQAARG